MARMIALWTFACKLYSEPSVKNACLALQDQYDVNVPLLLTACWVSQHNIELKQDLAEHLCNRAAHWQSGCIDPLRQLRRDMKTADTNSAGGDSGEGKELNLWGHVREQVKSVELAAEKALLDTLEQVVLEPVVSGKAVCSEMIGAHIPVRSMIMNIHYCLPHLFSANGDVPPSIDPLIAPLLATIIHAANPQIQYDDVLAQIECYRA